MSEKQDLRGAPVAIGMVVLALLFGGVALAIYPGWEPIGKFLVENLKLTEQAPAWVQAVGSVLAIIATALGIRWQILKSKEIQDQVERRNNIHMSETCLEMCNAIFSIIESKEEIGGNYFKNKYIYDFNSDETSLLSIERLSDLQETIRLIIMKNLPVDLLKSLFQLQKIVAKYKEIICYDVTIGKIMSRDKFSFLKNEHKKIRGEVNAEIRKIVSYRSGLIHDEK